MRPVVIQIMAIDALDVFACVRPLQNIFPLFLRSKNTPYPLYKAVSDGIWIVFFQKPKFFNISRPVAILTSHMITQSISIDFLNVFACVQNIVESFKNISPCFLGEKSNFLDVTKKLLWDPKTGLPHGFSKIPTFF